MLRRYVMAATLAVAAGCGGKTSPSQAPMGAPPPPVSVEPAALPTGATALGVAPLANPACIIAAPGDIGVNNVLLRFHGKTFARLYREKEKPVEAVEVRLGPGNTGGTAFVRSNYFELLGEIALDDFWVGVQRPRLQDGFWIVRSFKATAVTAPGQLAGLSELPGELGSGERPVSFPCAELDLNTSRESPVGKDPNERWAFARPSRSDIRLALGGPVVATMNAPPPSGPAGPFYVAAFAGYVLERRGADVKLLIEGRHSTVIGWADARILAAKKPPHPPIQWGWGASVPMRRCPFPVPIFVRDGAVEVQVGVVRAGAPIQEMTMHAPGLAPDESPLAGLNIIPSERRADTELTPYVKQAALQTCETVMVSHPVRVGGGNPDDWKTPVYSGGP